MIVLSKVTSKLLFTSCNTFNSSVRKSVYQFCASELSAEAKILDCPETRAMDAHPGADSARGPHTRAVAASQGSALTRSG